MSTGGELERGPRRWPGWELIGHVRRLGLCLLFGRQAAVAAGPLAPRLTGPVVGFAQRRWLRAECGLVAALWLVIFWRAQL